MGARHLVLTMRRLFARVRRPSVRVRRLVPDDWRTWRDVRLESLTDAPQAFGSSLGLEEEFDEMAWRTRMENGITAVAFAGDKAVGAIAGHLPEDGDYPMLAGAWVRAEARGTGVGDALVAEVLRWSREGGHAQVHVQLAETNRAARKLLLRNGFAPSGLHMSLTYDPRVRTELLVRKLGVAAR